MLGLPELPHVGFDGAARSGAAHWKLGPLEAYGRGRAMAWIDDNFDQSCYDWAQARPEPTLLVLTEPQLGLEEAHVDALTVGGVSRLIAVTGFWPIFFLLVVLKIPVLGSIWLVWWASQATPEPDGAEDSDGGFKRRPRPKLPRGPRRGPHGGGARDSPARLPSGRPHQGRQARCPASFRSRRISRR